MEHSILHPHKPADELVMVVTKDSASLLAKKFSSKDVRHSQLQDNAKQEKKCQTSAQSDLSPSNPSKDEKVMQGHHGQKSSTMKEPLLRNGEDLVHNMGHACVPAQSYVEQTVTGGHTLGDDGNHNNNQEVGGVSPSFNGELAIEDAEVRPSLSKLKRSRSCEESMRPEVTQPQRRMSFQESRFSPQPSRLETIPEPQFGTTKYLEGLDLVDALPARPSQSEIPCCTNGELRYDSNGLSMEFFNLKNRYLSSCSQRGRHDRLSTTATYCKGGDSAEDAMAASFALMHSRSSSLGSLEEMEMASVFPCMRHPIPAVVEEDEEACLSDGSETFEFKKAIAPHPHTQNELEKKVQGEVHEEDHDGSFNEVSVVATGDAVLYTSSKSEDFDLIPSKSYVRSRPKQASIPSSAMAAASPYSDSFHRRLEENKQFSVDDIISLMESEELDDDVLLSFLNMATTTSHGSNGGAPSCHASDIASEASFEFKVKSSGSTPHSTPSTPMLSAGSTPKRINQLSPLALTPEEIAEIWGVFEQRQAMSNAPYM